ncbi:MAG: orotidine-5'-phosphate decarboxylase [Spirochaetales bacterium]|nr:orotidine-5'-phosphate decarboxylase [Spirochaetales bacterium]
MTFFQKLQKRIQDAHTLLCVGLDPRVPQGEDPFEFLTVKNRRVIEAAGPYTACFKPNIAFYEAHGIAGMRALEATLKMIGDDIPVIIDAKRNDIGATAEAYAKAVFDVLGADAVTLNPYMGKTSADPFLAYADKGYFLLCRTSNPGAGDIQELSVAGPHGSEPLFINLARQLSTWSDRIGLVVGGNDPQSLAAVRKELPDIWFLAPGIGAQGGTMEEAVFAGIRSDGMGILPMVGRAVYDAPDPAQAAREYRDALNAAREKALAGTGTGAAAAYSKHETELKDDICQGLIDTGCFQLGDFTLKSGKKSPFYIDMRKIQSDPRFLARVGKAYGALCSRVSRETGAAKIAGIPLAALPLATAASLSSGLPLVYPRMSVKSHGTGKLVEGEFTPGEAVILLDDLITTGLSKIEAAAILKEAGLEVADLVVLFERGVQGRKDMEQAGIRLHAYLHVEDLLGYLLAKKLISADTHKELIEYVRAD